MTVDLSTVNPGDEVVVEIDDDGHTATVTGKVWENCIGCLCVGWVCIRWQDRRTAGYVTRLVSHTPALPDWATDQDVVVVQDRDGDPWMRDGDLWLYRDIVATSGELVTCHGPCTVYARRAES